MKNPIKQYDSEITQIFLTFSILSNLDLYKGQKDIKTLVSEFVQHIKDGAKKEEQRGVFKEIAAVMKERIDDYVVLITKIIDIVCKIAYRVFEDKNFRIVSARTNFYFKSHRINILFIIEANTEQECEFVNILLAAQNVVLKEENYIAELFYINKRNISLDKIAINCDYPFERKIEAFAYANNKPTSLSSKT